MSSIRKQMLFFGVDLSHVSDDEIERRLVEATRKLASIGMPASDFARGLQRFTESARELGAALGYPEKG